MKQADAELAELDLQKRKYSPSLEARLSAVHQKVAAQLQQLQSVASKEGFSSHAPQWDKNQKIGDAMRLQRPALAEAKEGGFTSFPKASLKSVEASDGNAAALDDGALIRYVSESFLCCYAAFCFYFSRFCR